MKKLMSGFIAVCVSMITVLSSVASASFNPNKDPNGNGYMSISDSVYIDQYLLGHHEPTDLSQLDVDENDVVSTVDSQYVQMYDAGIISNVPEEVDSRSNISRTYYVYNAQTGAYKRNYTLSVPIDDNIPSNRGGEEEGNSRGIIGTTDDRIPDWSNRGTAKIMCSEVDAGYTGTGFVVGPHTIATAAHVVFDTEFNDAYSLDEILLFDADHTDHSFTPVEYHVPLSFINSSDYTTTNDYALITVEEDMSNYMSFNLGSVTDSSATNNLTIVTVGFPLYTYSNIQGQNTANSTQINSASVHDERLSTGSIINLNSNVIEHTADTSGGNSGGPIYAVESLNGVTYHTVIGIHVGCPTDDIVATYNYGVRFNASILKFYNANSNIQY